MRLQELLLFERKNSFEVLKANKIPLTPEERDLVMKSGATWNFGPNGEASPAVWKSKDSKGKIKFVTHTHRAYRDSSTLSGAISAYHNFIKGTS